LLDSLATRRKILMERGSGPEAMLFQQSVLKKLRFTLTLNIKNNLMSLSLMNPANFNRYFKPDSPLGCSQPSSPSLREGIMTCEVIFCVFLWDQFCDPSFAKD
jgi:hypothetical protein